MSSMYKNLLMDLNEADDNTDSLIYLKDLLAKAGDVGNSALNKITGVGNSALNKITDVGNAFSNATSGTVDGISNALHLKGSQYDKNATLLQGLQNDSDAQLNSVGDKNIPPDIIDSIKNIGSNLKYNSQNILSSIKDIGNDLKNNIMSTVSDHPELAKVGGSAAAALALYYAWRKLKSRKLNNNVQESIDYIIDNSFNIVNEIKSQNYNQCILIEQLSDNAKMLITYAMKDPIFPNELKKSLAVENDIIQKSSINNISEFKSTDMYKKTVQYIDKINRSANKKSSIAKQLLAESIIPFSLWKSYNGWMENKPFDDVKCGIVNSFGYDPLIETKMFMRRIDKIINSPEFTLSNKSAFDASIINETRSYKNKIIYSIKHIVEMEQIPLSVYNKLIKCIVENDETTDDDSNDSNNSDVESNITAFKNFTTAGNKALENIKNSDAPDSIKMAASRIKNNMEIAADNLKNRNDDINHDNQNNANHDTLSNVNSYINTIDDLVKNLKQSNKNMNTVWMNAQRSIPEIKGKSYNQTITDFKNNKLSPILMNKIIQNISSQR